MIKAQLEYYRDIGRIAKALEGIHNELRYINDPRGVIDEELKKLDNKEL